MTTITTPAPAETNVLDSSDLTRISARFGVAFTICQLSVMVLMAILVLPHGGSPSDPALPRGQGVLDAETLVPLGQLRLHACRHPAARLPRRRALAAAPCRRVRRARDRGGRGRHPAHPDLAARRACCTTSPSRSPTPAPISGSWPAGTRSRRTAWRSPCCRGSSSSARSCSGCAGPAPRRGCSASASCCSRSAWSARRHRRPGRSSRCWRSARSGYELWVGALAWHWLRASRP